MDYLEKFKYHFKPEKGWINDPNGLVYYKGYYHIFYQHCPNYETPGKESMHWGHARTKDFLSFEELPVALYPDREYDAQGCFSGTATVKDDVLYLFYASIRKDPDAEVRTETVSMAYSVDGINFQKYEGNPIIRNYPADGGPDFRDPAVFGIDGKYYCVMATGNPETRTGRLLLYVSDTLTEWSYLGIMKQWEQTQYAECPSLMSAEDLYLLTASVWRLDRKHYFAVMYGDFSDGKFTEKYSAEVDKGPDQYAGQVFRDHLGRNILISWIPGWRYIGFASRDVGCLSVPRELKLKDGRITAYPIAELQHLLKDSDPCLVRTEKGFTVTRHEREPIVYEGDIRELKILRDGCVAEIFVNGGEEVFTALL